MQENQIHRKETCPWGQKAIDLLKKRSITYKDHIFDSKDEENSFKEKHGVKTTPQIFLDGDRIGGYTDLAEKLGEEVDEPTSSEQSYRCLLYTSPSPRDRTRSRMPSSA